MSEIDDILPGRDGRESDSYEAKPRRRSRDVKDALTLVILCCKLQASGLDEGPLRTKILELAAKAQAALEKSKA